LDGPIRHFPNHQRVVVAVVVAVVVVVEVVVEVVVVVVVVVIVIAVAAALQINGIFPFMYFSHLRIVSSKELGGYEEVEDDLLVVSACW